jgi:hypothetical protein
LSKKNSENIQNQYYLNHATTENITAEYFPNINAKVEIDATTQETNKFNENYQQSVVKKKMLRWKKKLSKSTFGM